LELGTIQKRLAALHMLEKSLNALAIKGTENQSLEDEDSLRTEIIQKYEQYLQELKYPFNAEVSENARGFSEVTKTGHGGWTRPRGSKVQVQMQVPPHRFEEDFSVLAPTGKKRTKSSHNPAYRNVGGYQDSLHRVYERDAIRMIRNRNYMQNMYAEEANWLYQLKSEVAKPTYSYAKPF
jgi:hypothetical protein